MSEEDLLLLATKSIEKYLMLVLLKNIITFEGKKYKIGKMIKNNCSTTKSFRKPKHC